MYNLVSTFRTAGYNRNATGYLYADRRLFSRDGSHNLGIDLMTHRHAAPVHGIPTQARQTLLAQLLGNSKTAAQLLGGKFVFYSADGARESIRLSKQYYGNGGQDPVPGLNRMVRDRLFNSDRLKGKLISVEIECYKKTWGTNPDRTGVLTEITHDGSLNSGNRYGDQGREIRRISWANESGRMTGLLGLKSYLAGARVDKTCGLHVHLDVRHLPKPGEGTPYVCDAAETYDRMTMLYPVLKKLIPRSRWNNQYCRFYNNRDGSDTYRCPGNGQRYAAINWCAYREHKTIEVRCGSGSVNLVKIESWAMLMKFLLDWCSVRQNSVPTRWPEFLAILPGWMKSWCILRNMKLHGGLEGIDARIVSAADYTIETGVTPTE